MRRLGVSVSLSLPQVALSYGDKWDGTKVVSPDVVMLPDGRYLMCYVGTNCPPTQRSGYRLLRASSHDGISFEKDSSPLLALEHPDDKHYSPRLVQWSNHYLLFYGLGAKGKYTIRLASSSDGLDFTPHENVIIDTGPHHLAAIHSPKVIVDSENELVCYYTGSNSAAKIYSREHPSYDFANGFRLFRSSSKNGINFSSPEVVEIKDNRYLNTYGHNVLQVNKSTYMVFSGFDGNINRVYITKSSDGLFFDSPTMLVEPDSSLGELGVYSSSLVPTGGGQYRLYYGCRYFDNRWKILTRTLEMAE